MGWHTADGMRRCPGPHLIPVLDHASCGRNWGADSMSPSADVPIGCSIEHMFFRCQVAIQLTQDYSRSCEDGAWCTWEIPVLYCGNTIKGEVREALRVD